MTTDQFEKLLDALSEFAVKSNHYTITGADDWTMLLVIGGLLVSAVIAMWADLSNKLVANRKDSRLEIRELKAEHSRQFDLVWEAMRHCQEDCCPRRREVPRDTE